MAENEKIVEGNDLNKDSRTNPETLSEPLKPWMKTLGKEFYSNKELACFDSLQDAVKSLLGRPSKKIPDEYGKGDADELFRKAYASREDADAIDEYYRKKIPERKERKEVFGDKYEEDESRYAKAVMMFGSDMDEPIKRNGLDKDPYFARIMARVGSLSSTLTRKGLNRRVAITLKTFWRARINNAITGTLQRCT